MLLDAALNQAGRYFAQAPQTTVEWSLRIDRSGLTERSRFTCWIDGPRAEAFQPVAAHLASIDAPENVQVLQAALAPCSKSQGLCTDLSGTQPDYRLYIHHLDPDSRQVHYDAFRWRGKTHAEMAEYEVHFLPESPDGTRPADVVSPALKSFLNALLQHDRLQQTGAFWLRRMNAVVDQLDLTWVWQPALSEIRSELEILCVMLGFEPSLLAPYLDHHFRHVTLSCGEARNPAATVYFSAKIGEMWPQSFAGLKETVRKNASAQHQGFERSIFSRLPELPKPNLQLEEAAVQTWQAVFGPCLHLHQGIFQPDETPALAGQFPFDRAVSVLFPFIPAQSSVYDIGCGWGGAAAMLKARGCRVVGITNHRSEYRYCASQGLDVRLGDAEATIPPGSFDVILMLESFEFIAGKRQLLNTLRLFGHRLVMRVNCQEDSSSSKTTLFGASHLISADQLRDLLETSGWQIVHWQNRREQARASIAVWQSRLADIPPGGELALESLRRCIHQAWTGDEDWMANHPLIEIVAE